MSGDPIVFDDRTHYIGYIDQDGAEGWYRWPAVSFGWRQRKAHPAPVDDYRGGALPSNNAELALRLSGVIACLR